MACLSLLYELQLILFRGDRAHLFADLLGEVAAAHHDMYLNMYPLCRRPKNHYLLHVPRLGPLGGITDVRSSKIASCRP